MIKICEQKIAILIENKYVLEEQKNAFEEQMKTLQEELFKGKIREKQMEDETQRKIKEIYDICEQRKS